MSIRCKYCPVLIFADLVWRVQERPADLAPLVQLIADEALIVEMPSAGHVGHAPIGGVRPRAVSADCGALGLHSCFEPSLEKTLEVAWGIFGPLGFFWGLCVAVRFPWPICIGAGLPTCQPLPWIKWGSKQTGLVVSDQNGPTKTSPIQLFGLLMHICN